MISSIGAVDLAAREPEDRAVEADVLPAGELGVEAGAELDERGEPAVDVDRPSVGR